MEETRTVPKPMVTIGGKPILWHIMKIYSAHGINDFIVCLGHKGYAIKEYFHNFFIHNADVRYNLQTGETQILNSQSEPWNVTLAQTGELSLTAKRIAIASRFLDPGDQDFCLTYGDGVGDVDISESIRFHRAHNKAATVTLVSPPGRFGAAVVEGDSVTSFQEKPAGGNAHISAGFFVLSKKALELAQISENRDEMFENRPLQTLADQGQLMGYKHQGFWQPMDTLRDRTALEHLWEQPNPPWKIWK